MTELDEIVRASLRAQVLQAPPMTAPADRAIAAAGKVRRRHAITAVCAAVVAVALAGGGVASLRDGALGHHPVPPATQAPSPAPSVTPSPSASPTIATSRRPDLLVDQSPDGNGWRTLLTSTGRTIPLTGLDGPAQGAEHVVGGWLITTQSSLWLVTPDGNARKLVQPIDGYALAPDRVHLAWRANNRLYVGHLSGTTLQPDQSTPAPQRGFPIAYTGSAVVLGYSETGGGIDNHDVWVPARGDYSPAWNKTPGVVAVYQPAPDGTLYGVANVPSSSKNACLAVLDPMNNLQVTRTACGSEVLVDPSGLVSPDGHWLSVQAFVDGQPGVVLFDLAHVLSTAVASQTWIALAPLTWLDPTTVVLLRGDSTLVIAQVGQPTLTSISGLPDQAEVIP